MSGPLKSGLQGRKEWKRKWELLSYGAFRRDYSKRTKNPFLHSLTTRGKCWVELNTSAGCAMNARKHHRPSRILNPGIYYDILWYPMIYYDL